MYVLIARISRRDALTGCLDVGDTCRELDVLSGVSKLYLDAQSARLATCLESTLPFAVKRHHDATPVFVEFGRLAAAVLPSAKFFLPDASGKLQLVSHAAYLAGKPRAKPRFGVLEMLAFEAQVSCDGCLQFG